MNLELSFHQSKGERFTVGDVYLLARGDGVDACMEIPCLCLFIAEKFGRTDFSNNLSEEVIRATINAFISSTDLDIDRQNNPNGQVFMGAIYSNITYHAISHDQDFRQYIFCHSAETEILNSFVQIENGVAVLNLRYLYNTPQCGRFNFIHENINGGDSLQLEILPSFKLERYDDISLNGKSYMTEEEFDLYEESKSILKDAVDLSIQKDKFISTLIDALLSQGYITETNKLDSGVIPYDVKYICEMLEYELFS